MVVAAAGLPTSPIGGKAQPVARQTPDIDRTTVDGPVDRMFHAPQTTTEGGMLPTSINAIENDDEGGTSRAGV